jgi:hypothetical protein
MISQLAWAIYRSGGDYDLSVAVATQMYEVCDRLPVRIAQASLVRCGFVDDRESRHAMERESREDRDAREECLFVSPLLMPIAGTFHFALASTG